LLNFISKNPRLKDFPERFLGVSLDSLHLGQQPPQNQPVWMVQIQYLDGSHSSTRSDIALEALSLINWAGFSIAKESAISPILSATVMVVYFLAI